MPPRPDLAEQPKLAEPSRRRSANCRRAGEDRPGPLHRVAPQVFHHQERGEEDQDLVGELGILSGVFLGRCILAPPLPFEEFLGEFLDRVAMAARGRHEVRPLIAPYFLLLKPGSDARIREIRLRARM